MGGSLSGHSDSNLLVLKSDLTAARLSAAARLSRSQPDCCQALFASTVAAAAAMAGTAVVDASKARKEVRVGIGFLWLAGWTELEVDLDGF